MIISLIGIRISIATNVITSEGSNLFFVFAPVLNILVAGSFVIFGILYVLYYIVNGERMK